MAKPRLLSIPYITAFASAFALAALAVVFASQPLQAQSITYPSAPTNVSVTASSNTALITWQSGGSGVNGSCATEDYNVQVYDMGGAGFPIAAESDDVPHPNSGNPSWYVDELIGGKWYYVTVFAYGSSCDEWSDTAGTYKFLTSSSVSAPSKPMGNKKRLPRRVRNLNVTHSGTTATASWDPAPTGGGTKRCETYAADEQLHTYFLENLDTGETVSTGDIEDEENPSVDLTGLVSGTRYYVSVESYSWDCDNWSKQRIFQWTQ